MSKFIMLQVLPADPGLHPNILKISQATLPHCFQVTPQIVLTLKLLATLPLPLSAQETPLLHRRIHPHHPPPTPLSHHHATRPPPTPP